MMREYKVFENPELNSETNRFFFTTDFKLTIKITINNEDVIEELKILRKLKEIDGHEDHIVNFIEAFNIPNKVCIIYQQYAMDLFNFCEKILDRIHSPIQYTTHILRSLIDSIKFLHSNRIIHCDLKLENAVIHWDGYVKLIDFQLSRDFPANKGELYTDLVGTECTDPPELKENTGWDESLDIYHFGIMISDLPCIPGGDHIYFRCCAKLPSNRPTIFEVDQLFSEKIEKKVKGKPYIFKEHNLPRHCLQTLQLTPISSDVHPLH